MQTFAINIIPLFFGLKIAILSSIFYFIAIGYGLSVGAGGEGAYKKLYGPTGGYLVGFILASFQIGFMYENDPTKNIFTPVILGNLIILIVGCMWLPFGLSYKTGKKLSNFTNIKDILMWGLIPFIPGDLIKIGLAIITIKIFDGYVPNNNQMQI